MTAREWVSPSVRVTQTSMGTIAMTEMDVIQPTIARPRTESDTAGAAYVRSLHTAQAVKKLGRLHPHAAVTPGDKHRRSLQEGTYT